MKAATVPGPIRAASAAERHSHRGFITNLFSVSCAPGIIVSNFWGELQGPGTYAAELVQFQQALTDSIHLQDGDFVSLIDVVELGKVHGQSAWAMAMLRLFRELPRGPTRRAVIVGGPRHSAVPAAVLHAATMGQVRVFEQSARDQVIEWLGGAGTCSREDLGAAW